MIDKIDKWHKTKTGLLAFSLLEFLLTYIFISLAIDRGGLGWYLLTLLFLIGGLQNLFKLIGAVSHGQARRTR